MLSVSLQGETMMKHLYRKSFDHAFEAEGTANSFVIMPNLHPSGPVDVSVSHTDGKHWVYISFEGEYDAEELFAATGYERIA